MPSAAASAEPPAVIDIARLVRSAQAGDGDAFAELYQRFARMVHGVVLARIARTEVDDVVQDVFMAAFERLGELRDPAAFGGWLAAIARNRAADHRRRLMPVHPVVDAPAPARAHEQAEAHAILAVIRALPEAYSETLVLRLVEGMTGEEIAERTGLTPGSVRVNLHRGMKLLREKLS